jgi:hypothetical protein
MIAGSFYTETILQRYVLNATAVVMVAVAGYIAGRYIFRDVNPRKNSDRMEVRIKRPDSLNSKSVTR